MKKAPTQINEQRLSGTRTPDYTTAPLTISQRRHIFRANHFLRPGCIAPLPEDIEQRRVKRWKNNNVWEIRG